MKRIILLSTGVLLIANLLLGAILSAYGVFNMLVSSAVIAATGLLLYYTCIASLKDGYKVSLMLLFSVGGLIEFVLSLVAPNRLTDNWWLIVIIGFLAAEIILLIITHTVSNKIK